jgi:hypothetical protein
VQYYVGCSGWSYSAWQGPFYPVNIESSHWLNYYAHIFDYVEIDSVYTLVYVTQPNLFTEYLSIANNMLKLYKITSY